MGTEVAAGIDRLPAKSSKSAIARPSCPTGEMDAVCQSHPTTRFTQSLVKPSTAASPTQTVGLALESYQTIILGSRSAAHQTCIDSLVMSEVFQPENQ